MYILKLIKNKDGYYEHIDFSALEEWILYLFLTSDVHCSNVDYYIKLAYDPGFGSGYGNAICIEKEGEYISLCLEVDVREEEDQAKAVWVKIPIPQFVTFLETWRDKVCKKRPQEVIIRFDNQEFIFEIKQ